MNNTAVSGNLNSRRTENLTKLGVDGLIIVFNVLFLANVIFATFTSDDLTVYFYSVDCKMKLDT